MKKIVLFILLMLPAVVFGQIKWADEPGDRVRGSFKVFQVVSDYKALVQAESSYGYHGMLYLFWKNDSKVQLYDDAIIKAPKGEEFRIVGTFRYDTKGGYEKTVPVIQLMEKQKKSKKKDKKHKSDDL